MELPTYKHYGSGWVLALAAVVLFGGVLSLYRSSDAGAHSPGEPFANPTAQRSEMIAYLKEIRDLLKEQNALLKSGTIQVVVVEPASKTGKP